MKKANQSDSTLIAKAMNLKTAVVSEIINGMYYESYSELVMAVMICMKPLPMFNNDRGGRDDI